MKKIFFSLFFLCLLGISSKAQPYQGPIEIWNSTECDAYWDIVAICPGPPCQEYSKSNMAFIGHATPNPNPTQPNIPTIQSFYPDAYPWYEGEHPCPDQDWTWAIGYVHIDAGEGCTQVIVGLPGITNCQNNTYPQDERVSCTCNGKDVYVTFSVINGIPTLNISY